MGYSLLFLLVLALLLTVEVGSVASPTSANATPVNPKNNTKPSTTTSKNSNKPTQQKANKANTDPKSTHDVSDPIQYTYIGDSDFESIETQQNQHHRFHQKRIAICITGQIGRFIPRYILKHLIEANPDYIFRVFIQLQVSSIYNTHPDPIYEASEFTHFNDYALFKSIGHYFTQDNARLVQLGLSVGHSIEYWKQYLHLSRLDRIKQFDAEVQYKILDMYYKHFNCTQHIQQYESKYQFHFDYVILHREDIFYMGDMNLTKLLKEWMHKEEKVNPHNPQPNSRNFTYVTKAHSSSVTNDKEKYCDYLYKNCLTWGGVNLRVQLYRRNAALSLLGSRLDYYQYMTTNNAAIFNTEWFEKLQAESMGWKGCGVDVQDFPVLPIRITRGFDSKPSHGFDANVLHEDTDTIKAMNAINESAASSNGNKYQRLDDVSYHNDKESTNMTNICFLQNEVYFEKTKEICYREEYKTFLFENFCEIQIDKMKAHLGGGSKHHHDDNNNNNGSASSIRH